MILPVAERELRVAARRRSTSWSRVIAASGALLVGSAFVVLWMASPGSFVFGTNNEGRTLFSILSWLTFAAVLASGLFLTSDSISEEKREGTLGLLFLTDLRSHDVVVGKLLATSLLGFYGLLAVLPILAIPLLMGGVTGETFWKTILALITTMLLSLGVGMFTSALSRDSQKAVTATLALVVLLAGAGPGLDALLAGFAPNIPPWLSINRLTSPAFLLASADDFIVTFYWRSWMVHQVMTAMLFLGATWLAPRTWQDRDRQESSSSGWHRWRSDLRHHSAAWRRRFLSVNPVLWLMLRDRWQAWMVWIWALLCVDVVLLLLLSEWTALYAWSMGSGLLTLVFYLLASQSGRFLVDARQGGLLELLLSTPVTPLQIIQGQWRAWVRRFGPPIVMVVILQGILSWLAHWQMLDSMKTTFAAIPPPPAVVTTTGPASSVTTTSRFGRSLVVTSSTSVNSRGLSIRLPSPRDLEDAEPVMIVVITSVVVAGVVTTLCNLCAVFWFGLWTGLNGKRAATCSLRALLFVQVIPWLAFTFFSSILMPVFLMSGGMSGSPGMFFIWYFGISAGVFAILSLIKDGFFIMISRRKLYRDLRVRAAVANEARRVPPAPPVIPNKQGSDLTHL